MSVPGPVRRDVPPRPIAAGLALTAIVLTVVGGWWHTGSASSPWSSPPPKTPNAPGTRRP